ncbi:TyrR/PhhR family helix-turn-helix DNA-binding protein [Marinomonas ostreistagni]|uniref:TyrR/PhhR family helix-turn-helix DNA-binding protein n=1 Tax=Marinomonas ostreistagni TaxID=359209 RepID=UPI00194DC4AA|nr:TyrR/PhhR family helix-turn-helix DNA-binding protein [Marinomonas ostreistagni]MBM6551956.1 transcriptional regulator [Marinomonas ostreistagni]
MRLEVRCEDRVGMAREILDLLIPYHIDMRRIEVDSQLGCLYVGFEDIGFEKLTNLLADIRRLRGVSDVKTVHFTPSEREQNALLTLLEALPDGVVAVDLKGRVTMATAQAAADLKVALDELIQQPLQLFIPSVAFARIDWSSGKGVSKRVRINGQLMLLEMQPFFVTNEAEQQVCAGAIIHLRSAKRLGRQTSNLRKASHVDSVLSGFLQSNVTKSAAMQRCLAFAQAYIESDQPMLLTGEFAVGKKRLLQALFHAWQEQFLEPEATLNVVSAKSLSSQSLMAYLAQPGWCALTHIEALPVATQNYLSEWLANQPSQLYQERAPTRVIGLSLYDSNALQQEHQLGASFLYMLQGFNLVVPPLRERKEDLAGLACDILQEAAERKAIAVPKLTKEALVTLKMHTWPGNLKELESCLLQALDTVQDGEISAQALPITVLSEEKTVGLIDGSLDKTVKAYEAELLRKLYPQYPSTRKLAKFLDVSHSSIANKLKEYGIV